MQNAGAGAGAGKLKAGAALKLKIKSTRPAAPPFSPGNMATTEDADLALFLELAEESGDDGDEAGPSQRQPPVNREAADAPAASTHNAVQLTEGDDIFAQAARGGHPRLSASWADKAGACGAAGAVPAGYQPRQAVKLPPGAIPRS